MADLKEQLLKAGLITEDQAKRSAHKNRQENKNLGRAGREKIARDNKEEATRQAQTKAKSDRQTNREQQQERQQKEGEQQGRQRRQSTVTRALTDGRVANWEGGRTYYFADDGEVRYLQVNEDTAKLLETGKAAIVRENNRRRYAVLVSGAAKTLQEADPKRIVTFHQP